MSGGEPWTVFAALRAGTAIVVLNLRRQDGPEAFIAARVQAVTPTLALTLASFVVDDASTRFCFLPRFPGT